MGITIEVVATLGLADLVDDGRNGAVLKRARRMLTRAKTVTLPTAMAA